MAAIILDGVPEAEQTIRGLILPFTCLQSITIVQIDPFKRSVCLIHLQHLFLSKSLDQAVIVFVLAILIG